MYHIFFTTFNKEKAKTSKEAMDYADENFGSYKVPCEGWQTSNNVQNIVDWSHIGERAGTDYLSQKKYKSNNLDYNATLVTKELYDKFLKIFEQFKVKRPSVEWSHVDLETEIACLEWIKKYTNLKLMACQLFLNSPLNSLLTF